MEFCLYIHKGGLVAISQKDTSVFYPFLMNKREELSTLLTTFVQESECNNFPVEQCMCGEWGRNDQCDDFIICMISKLE